MTDTNPFELRQLGRTRMKVTAVSLGGAGLGGIFGPVGDAEGISAVEKALELGVNYLDTSPKYGEAERRMGMALRGVPRQRYYISSKVGTHPGHPGDYTGPTARWTVENSLTVLGVDYLDLCHIHEPEPHQLDQALAPGGALETLVELKAEGLIKAIGIGVEDHELHRRAIGTGVLDVAMMVNDYTLLERDFEDIAELAGERGVGLVNGAPLAMGLLSGRDPDTIGTPKWTPPADQVRGAKTIHRWCAQRDVPVLALALQFALRQRAFDCTLVGSATATEVAQAWDALTTPIPAEVWSELPALLEELAAA